MENSMFVNAAMVAADFGISESKAYTIIKQLNTELKEKGYLTVAGRVSRQYYQERTYSIPKREMREENRDGRQ